MCKVTYEKLRPPHQLAFLEQLDIGDLDQLSDEQIDMLLTTLQNHANEHNLNMLDEDEFYLKCYMYVITVLFLCLGVSVLQVLFNRFASDL